MSVLLQLYPSNTRKKKGKYFKKQEKQNFRVSTRVKRFNSGRILQTFPFVYLKYVCQFYYMNTTCQGTGVQSSTWKAAQRGPLGIVNCNVCNI